MGNIQIPTLLFWENGNSWYGSFGNARFFIEPQGEGHGQLSVRLWRGPLSMELSEIVSSAVFPTSEEGLAQAAAWLEEQAAELER